MNMLSRFLLRILPVKHEPTSCVKTPAEIVLRFISACIINSCKADVDPSDPSDNSCSHLLHNASSDNFLLSDKNRTRQSGWNGRWNSPASVDSDFVKAENK